MGIHRLPNGIVKIAVTQASCVWGRRASAKGALSFLAWGNRPRHSIAGCKSAEGALQPASANSIFALQVNRAFSARGVSILQILGRRPRLAMRKRRWRNGILTECITRRSHRDRLCVIVLLFAIAPITSFGAAKTTRMPELAGYKAVRVHYGPLNKMIMSVNINGQPAQLLVDTGSNQTILNADAAQSFGVRPSQLGLRYIRFTQVNGEVLPVGFAQSLTADGMNFGGNPVTLRRSLFSGSRNADVDGVLGLDILLRHNAMINCRTRFVFFKIDRARQMDPGAIVSSRKFTRVPLRREQSGALTVPCAIQGKPAHMLVDTGAFLTTFNEGSLKPLGLVSEPTRVSARFSSGAKQRMNVVAMNDLKIGDFKVPQKKFGVTALPRLALHQGGTTISGILGIETLYNCHAIVDLGSMNLFLK
jgi:predicted aspartyl protease